MISKHFSKNINPIFFSTLFVRVPFSKRSFVYSLQDFNLIITKISSNLSKKTTKINYILSLIFLKAIKCTICLNTNVRIKLWRLKKIQKNKAIPLKLSIDPFRAIQI